LDGNTTQVKSSMFLATRAMAYKISQDTMFSSEEKARYDLTGTTLRMSYGGSWLGDSLACEKGKFSGHIWEFAYMLHKLTSVTIHAAPTMGWAAAGDRGNPDKQPLASADGGDDIVIGWKEGPTPVRNQYYTNMITVTGGSVAPSNIDGSLRHNVFTRPEDKDKFKAVLDAATMDPNDMFAVSRVLMTTPIAFSDGTRIPRLCSCPCATLNYLLYDPNNGLNVDVNDHYFFGAVTAGSPEVHSVYGYDSQWFDGVLRGVCDYTVTRGDFEFKLNSPEYDFENDEPTNSGKTYRDLMGVILASEFGRNAYQPIAGDGMYVAKDAPNHDKVVAALKKLVEMGVYDLIQTKWDAYGNNELGVVPGMCTEINCFDLATNGPANETPVTDNTFSWCADQTYLSMI